MSGEAQPSQSVRQSNRDLARQERAIIDATLTCLRDDHGFIGSWRRDGSRWWINEAPDHRGWGPYGLREMRGFLDGCRAMGAAI